MDIEIQILTDNAKLPAYSYEGDAGMDLTAVSLKVVKNKENGLIFEYGTGISMAIPEGYVGLLFPRSSISKYGLSLCNSVGIIDSNYRGEIICKFKSSGGDVWAMRRYKTGDRIAQILIVPYPQVTFKIVNELPETVRAMAGFGSSGE
tara:strand:- start:21647 stop:22090 length:444 start_codon:yes stop_codon:yes gene_type:complete